MSLVRGRRRQEAQKSKVGLGPFSETLSEQGMERREGGREKEREERREGRGEGGRKSCKECDLCPWMLRYNHSLIPRIMAISKARYKFLASKLIQEA